MMPRMVGRLWHFFLLCHREVRYEACALRVYKGVLVCGIAMAMRMKEAPQKKAFQNRDTVNLLAVIFLLVVLAVVYCVTDFLARQNAIEKCLESGRRNCGVEVK